MRIAQVAPLAESVPPYLYGGTERVIAWLTDQLVELGHDVTLFATGDSSTRAKLVPVWARSLRLGRPRSDPMAAQAALLAELDKCADQFDLIHCHLDWLHLPLLDRGRTPFISTLHGRLDLPGLPQLVERFPNAPFVSISNDQRHPLAHANWVGTVYHGLPAQLLRPSLEAGSYLAFLGRISPEKGPDRAINIAQAAGLPLRIAAKIPRGERRYYTERIEPQVDGDRIQIIGEVNDAAKQEFLGNAAALIFPIDWPEPFGLVMIEAMACGTPVIAFRRGSVPEIVDDGVTGYIVEDEAAAINAVGRLSQLDRREVRRQFERRFTSERMARDYIRLYERLVGKAQARDVTTAQLSRRVHAPDLRRAPKTDGGAADALAEQPNV
jgi:glycosyltransferase involved in cell wall biosynthesis